MKKLLILCFLTICLTQCEPKDEAESTSYGGSSSGVRCDSSRTNRVGAVCNDGSRSSATGSGACSHHGGVNYWLCN